MSTNNKRVGRYPEIEVQEHETQYTITGIVTLVVSSNVDLEKVIIDENWNRLSHDKSALAHVESEIHVEAKIPFELEKIAEMNEGWQIGVDEVEWSYEGETDID